MANRNGAAAETKYSAGANGILPSYVPPSSVEAEICTLGAMLIERRAVEIAGAMLTPPDFYRVNHQTLFRAIMAMSEGGVNPDMVTLKEHLLTLGEFERVGGDSYLVALLDTVPTAANIEHYAGIVRDKSILRNLNEVGLEISGVARGEVADVPAVVDHAQRMVSEVGARSAGTGLIPFSEAVSRVFSTIEERADNPVSTTGLATGFPEIDRLLCGLKPGGYYIFAGRPSMGKTAAAIKVGLNVAGAAHPVAIFSGEMDADQLAVRAISERAEVESNALMTGHLKKTDLERATKAAGEIYSLPIRVLDKSDTTVRGLQSACRRMKAEGGLSLVIVDYIGLLRGRRDRDNRREEVGEISRDLKRMALELSVPVIALSQLSRAVESRQDKRPIMSDLRESGDLEQDADAVCFLYRECYYKQSETHYTNEDGSPAPEEAEFIVAKNRNGPTGFAKIGFVKQFAKFLSLEAHDGKTGF